MGYAARLSGYTQIALSLSVLFEVVRRFFHGSEPVAPAGSMPQLTNPKVESRWVEARTVGNRYIEGHFEYIIAEPLRWNQ